MWSARCERRVTMLQRRMPWIDAFVRAIVLLTLFETAVHTDPIPAAEVRSVLGSGPFTLDPNSGVFASRGETMSYGFSLNGHEFELFELFLGYGEGAGNGLLQIPSLTMC